jgi:hypothetical protein
LLVVYLNAFIHSFLSVQANITFGLQMSNGFNERFLSLFFGLAVILILASGATNFLMIFSNNGNIAFYYAGSMLFGISFALSLRFYLNYKSFRESCIQGLYDPPDVEENRSWFKGKSKTEPILEPLNLNLESEDTCLKVCLAYAENKNLYKIRDEFGFRDATTSRRELQKGLRILLKEHDAKELPT